MNFGIFSNLLKHPHLTPNYIKQFSLISDHKVVKKLYQK